MFQVTAERHAGILIGISLDGRSVPVLTIFTINQDVAADDTELYETNSKGDSESRVQAELGRYQHGLRRENDVRDTYSSFSLDL
jgi:hypothetical protein